ncbi:dynamin-like protein A isoform X2 [Schistocerca gregaria]|uniref:dynamin-like protein A isoform X2 n=1 Tax=Schistocerca gregaria TaxID=7010 RepID=UPI00211F1EBB|nr:dynamin-like protein A isoform X2 [Schistocerca gregaria]
MKTDPNLYTRDPEFVMLGTGQCRRILLLEALVGHSLVHAKDWSPKRPIFFRLFSDRNQNSISIRIKGDTAFKANAADLDVKLEDFEAELERRNVASASPLEIEYRGYRYCNVVIIETPNMKASGEGAKDADHGQLDKSDSEQQVSRGDQVRKRTKQTLVAKEERVLKWCRPTHRKLIFFDPDTTDSVAILEKIDMRLGRSILVYDDLANTSNNLSSSKELNNYLASSIRGRSPDRIFFVNFFSPQTPLLDRKEYESGLQEMERDESLFSESLRIERHHQACIGVKNLVKAINKETWKVHQCYILGMLNQIHDLTLEASRNLKDCQARVQLLDPHHLRSVATTFITNLMSVIEKLLGEHMEDRPNRLGQTTLDERAVVGEWVDGNGYVVSLPVSDVPNGEALLQGGQQLQRLFTEFRLMMETLRLPDIQLDEIGTSIGAVRFNSSGLLRISAELVSSTLTKQLTPLVDHLVFYAKTLLKNFLQYAFHSIANGCAPSDATSKPYNTYRLSKNNSQYCSPPPGTAVISIDEFPYYTHYIKVHYFSVIEQLAQHCRRQCMDEFRNIPFFPWDLPSTLPHARDKKKFDLPRFIECVHLCNEKFFTSVKAQLTKNVLLKCHETFLNPTDSPLWTEGQASMSLFSDSKLHDLFQLSVKRDQYLVEEAQLSAKYNECQQRESKFQEASNILSYFLKT